jgi:hypothetical protein
MTRPQVPSENTPSASSTRTDRDLDELLGAYALNAVDDDERADIEAYLRRSPRAAAEVSQHLEVAGALGNTIGEAPRRLWDKIAELATVDAAENAFAEDKPSAFSVSAISVGPTRVGSSTLGSSPVTSSTVGSSTVGSSTVGSSTVVSIDSAPSKRKASPWRKAVAPFLVAASVTAIGGLSAQVMRQDNRISNLQAQVAAAKSSDAALQAILAAPQTRIVQLADEAGTPMAKVALASDGTGYVFGSKLPPLPTGQTYQLWGVADGSVLSLGVFGSSPKTTAFAASGSWSQFVFTAEQGQGVVASKAAAVAAGKLS